MDISCLHLKINNTLNWCLFSGVMLVQHGACVQPGITAG